MNRHSEQLRFASTPQLRSMLPFPVVQDTKCRFLHHTTSARSLLHSRHGSIHSDITSIVSSAQVSPLPPTPPPKDSVISLLPRRDEVMRAGRKHYPVNQSLPSNRVPRSRTLSSLPVSINASRGVVAGRLDTSEANFGSIPLPTTRLPSPNFTTRQYVGSRIPSLAIPSTKACYPGQTSTIYNAETSIRNAYTQQRRTTTFKENISPSFHRDTKVASSSKLKLPHIPSYAVSSSQLGFGSRLSAVYIHSHGLSRLETRETEERLQNWLDKHANGSSHTGESSSKQPLKGSMRRWISQPILSASYHADRAVCDQSQSNINIEASHHTPVIADTPSTRKVSTTGKFRRIKSFRSLLLRGDSNSPTNSSPCDPPQSKLKRITQAEPMAYWCGRFSALNDRYRTEDLKACLSNLPTTYDTMDVSTVHIVRMRRAIEELHSLCASPQALDSFTLFQSYIATLKRCELLRAGFRNRGLARIQLGGKCRAMSRADVQLGMSLSDARKATFMDRLLGRSRRSLL